MSASIRPLHLLLFLVTVSIWAFNFVVSKWGVAEIPPLFFVALRFAVVALVLLPFVPAPRLHWSRVFVLSVTLGLLHFSLMFTGLLFVPASTVALIAQLQVPFAALLAAIFLGDKLGWRRLLGLALAFLGVGIVLGVPSFEAPWWAEAMIVGAAFFWAVAAIQMKRLAGAVSGNSLNAWTAFFAVPQLLLASLVLESGQWEALSGISWRGAGAVLYNGLAVVVIGYGIWYRLLKLYDVNQAMPFTLLLLPFALLFTSLVLGEPLTWSIAVGGLLTLLGVGIVVLRRPRVAPPETARV